MSSFLSRDSEAFLCKISFQSIAFTKSLQQLRLSQTNIKDVIADLTVYRDYLSRSSSLDLYGSYRIKSVQSLLIKYHKYRSSGGAFTTCFNDLLGFREIVDSYPDPETIPDCFRIVNLLNGKRVDDGYRGLHLYYKKDSRSYPIELQIWDRHDAAFNILAHTYIYKYYTPQIGQIMREKYETGIIKTDSDFNSILSEVTAHG